MVRSSPACSSPWSSSWAESHSSGLSQLPTRISDVVKPWADLSPDHPALVETNGVLTYRQLASAISKTQTWLGKSGMRPGDRVMIVGENCREFVVLLLASAAFDAWPVLVNARLSARELDQIREHCGARRMLFTTSVSPHAADHAQRHGATVEDVDGLGSIAVGPLNETVEPEPIDEGANVADRIAALIYTSGTTGLPKGVMLSHGNFTAEIQMLGRVFSLSDDDLVLSLLPLHHTFEFTCGMLLPLASGATIALDDYGLAADALRRALRVAPTACIGR